jgi:hypothetical protein
MADSQYDQGLQAATTHDLAFDRALGRNRPCGLYTSWSFQARPEEAFRAAMKKKRIRPGRTGLRTKRPEAADYILASHPDLV